MACSIHDGEYSDSSLDDDFSFGTNLNHELDCDSDEENLVSEWSSNDIVNEQLLFDLYGPKLSCGAESSYSRQSHTAIYESKSNSNDHVSTFSRL